MSSANLTEPRVMKREESGESDKFSSPLSAHSPLSALSPSPSSFPSGRNLSASPSNSSRSLCSSTPSPFAGHQRLAAAPPSPRSHQHSLSSSSSGAAASPPLSSLPGSDEADSGISGFIRKTFNMVSDPGTADIVAWDEAGDSFIVKKEFEFASLVLPRYFRHKNFSSFVRQLNFYGFHKRSHQSKFTKFVHPCFKRGQLHSLHLIKRKSAEANVNFKDNIAQLTAQVTDLKRQYDDLYRIQQQILYIFARYMKAYPLPAQMDAAVKFAAGQPQQLIADERGGKRQRLLDDGAVGSAYSALPSASVGGLAPINTSTLAALLSSPSPLMTSLPTAAATSSQLSARDRELAELTALQSVLSQIPAGQALLNSHMEPMGAPMPFAIPTQPQPAAFAPAPLGAQTNSAVLNATLAAAMSGSAGSLSTINPLILSALGALGGGNGAGLGSGALPVHQSPAGTSAGYGETGAVLPVSAPLSSLPPLSSLSSMSAPPLSAQDLLQLLQHAHPNNRASRLSGIRHEQRMLEDEDDDLDDDDDFDADNDGQQAFQQLQADSQPSPDWMTAAALASSTLPLVSSSPDSASARYVTLTSPPHFHSQASMPDSKLSSLYHSQPSPLTGMVGMDGYSLPALSAPSVLPMQHHGSSSKSVPLSSLPSLKTQEIGSLFSNSAEPFFSLHNQLAAGSASQNASSSVSMSTSTVSAATPLHLKPSSSMPLDASTLQSLSSPAMQSTLQSTLAQLRSSLAANSSSQGRGGAGDGSYDFQTGLALVSQLQAIANVSKQLQSLHNPSLTAAHFPATPNSHSFPAHHLNAHTQQQQQPQQHLQQQRGASRTAGYAQLASRPSQSPPLLYDEYGKQLPSMPSHFPQQQGLMPPAPFTAAAYGGSAGQFMSSPQLFGSETLSSDGYGGYTAGLVSGHSM